MSKQDSKGKKEKLRIRRPIETDFSNGRQWRFVILNPAILKTNFKTLNKK